MSQEYIVSARKYRPATFDSVVGQRALTTTLLNAIRTGKLAHAYLFCGPRGVGKTTCARIFAKTINCLSSTAEGEACNRCESCRAFEEQRSMNIHELDAASNNSVDDIRELIDQVRIPPQGGKYKVFIIDEVHMLSSQAFNAFLKTLEEPPSYVIFILATTEKHKILPTILSRCQVYDFARMTIQNTVDHLAHVAAKEGYTAEPEALNLIAQKADGGMRDALSIFDQMVSFTGGNITYQSTLDNLNVLGTEYYFQLTDHFLKAEVEPALLLFNEVLAKGFDGGNFIAGLASHLRNLLVSRDAQTLPLLEVSEGVRAKYQEQAQRCRPAFLYQAIKLCNDCDVNYRQSRNKRLQVEICLIQAAQLNQEDAPGSGLRPSKTLKPLFLQPAARVAARVAPQRPPVPVLPQTPHIPSVAEPAPSYSPSAEKPSPQETASRPKPLRPLINLNDVCINQVSNAKQEKKEADEDLKDLFVTDRGQLTPDNLLQCWNFYANRLLQQEEVAMSNRLRGLKPEWVSASSFRLTVGSALTEEALKEHRKAIENFVARLTQVASIQMDILVQQTEAPKTLYSKPERLRRMIQHNQALEKLINGLALEID